MNKKYYQLKIKVSDKYKWQIEDILWEQISFGWEEGENYYIIYFPTEKECKDFAHKIKKQQQEITIEIKEIPAKNWQEDWKNFFKPVTIGKFKIVPSWQKEISLDHHELPIVLYPEMAFGTGHHETTRLCLTLIQKLVSEKKINSNHIFLDVGTGSGILAIALTKLGFKGVGLDIDPIILKNCKKNIELNKADNFSFFIGEVNAIKVSQYFSLIVANILLEPLLDLKQYFFNLLKQNGFLIISGILISQEHRILEHYKNLFGTPIHIQREGQWSSILWQKGH